MFSPYLGELPYFKNEIDETIQLLRSIYEPKIIDWIYKESDDKTIINDTKYAQPVIGCVSAALAKSLKKIGISLSLEANEGDHKEPISLYKRVDEIGFLF